MPVSHFPWARRPTAHHPNADRHRVEEILLPPLHFNLFITPWRDSVPVPEAHARLDRGARPHVPVVPGIGAMALPLGGLLGTLPPPDGVAHPPEP